MRNDWLWLVRKNLTLILRDRKSGLLHLILPIAGVLLSLLLYGNTNSGTLHIGIANNDGDVSIAADAADYLSRLEKVEVTMLDEAKLKEKIASREIDSGVVFPAGFSEKLKHGEAPAADIVSIRGAQVTAYVGAMLNEYLGNTAAIAQTSASNPELFDRLYEDFAHSGYQVSSKTLRDSSGKKDVTYQAIGFLILFMLTSSYSLTEFMSKERENRTFLRMMSSPVSSRIYVLANVTVNAIVLAVQIVLTLIFMEVVLGIDAGVPFGELTAILFLFALAAIGLSLLIVSFSSSNAASAALSNLVITPTCLLSGCFFPTDIMPDAVRRISSFLPQRWLLDSLDKLQGGERLSDLPLNLAILVAFAAAFALIAAYRLSRKDNTGQFV
ncbi:ABC transporter permease [Cohnella fermenti]|uniref:Transport permease protein n=1 Tax=Cohnella fermenti TaxID=2565925 RepID=A0A4S4BHD2_9BACL|nr:ABC transporter permease [Cohnella fermenti]THF73953.1 ABC transporter permease [Cohnella fermenti]